MVQSSDNENPGRPPVMTDRPSDPDIDPTSHLNTPVTTSSPQSEQVVRMAGFPESSSMTFSQCEHVVTVEPWGGEGESRLNGDRIVSGDDWDCFWDELYCFRNE